MDLTSSCRISLHMPRFDNSAGSPQPRPWRLFCMDFDGVTSLVNQDSLFSERYQHFRRTARPMAYVILCLRFTLLVRLVLPATQIFLISGFRTARKTRYGWLARPYPTGTFTLQDATSFACRTNAAISRGLLCLLFARKWERSDRAKSAQSKTSAALHRYALECHRPTSRTISVPSPNENRMRSRTTIRMFLRDSSLSRCTICSSERGFSTLCLPPFMRRTAS